jgi:hypothetical protein
VNAVISLIAVALMPESRCVDIVEEVEAAAARPVCSSYI